MRQQPYLPFGAWVLLGLIALPLILWGAVVYMVVYIVRALAWCVVALIRAGNRHARRHA